MAKISLVVGNGLSISFGNQSGISHNFDSQQPLNWNVICPTTGDLLIDNLPSLKRLWQKNISKPHFEIFGFALDKFYCNLIGLDSFKTTLEARHFLTIAFSEYSLLQSSKLNIDWTWFQWLELHKSEIKGALSFNYDLLLESTFDKLGVMDKIHAGVGSNAIYCLYLQGIKAMNQKTALFVMINTPRRMDAS